MLHIGVKARFLLARGKMDNGAAVASQLVAVARVLVHIDRDRVAFGCHLTCPHAVEEVVKVTIKTLLWRLEADGAVIIVAVEPLELRVGSCHGGASLERTERESVGSSRTAG